MNTQKSEYDILMGAAKEIQNRGWHQGWYFKPSELESDAPSIDEWDNNRAVCTMGAINLAMLGVPMPDSEDQIFALDILNEESATYHKAVNRLNETVRREHGTVPAWNDHPDTSKEEVIRTLQEVADTFL